MSTCRFRLTVFFGCCCCSVPEERLVCQFHYSAWPDHRRAQLGGAAAAHDPHASRHAGQRDAARAGALLCRLRTHRYRLRHRLRLGPAEGRGMYVCTYIPGRGCFGTGYVYRGRHSMPGYVQVVCRVQTAVAMAHTNGSCQNFSR